MTHRRGLRTLAVLGIGMAIGVAGGRVALGHPDAGAAIKPVLAEKLANVPGSSLSAVVVSYEPGGKSPVHHHAGSVFAYVLSGAIRSQSAATGPARVYQTGEAFFEPVGSAHLVSENASATAPASLLAVFVAEDGATLTTLDK